MINCMHDRLCIVNHALSIMHDLESLVRCEIKCKLCDAIGSNYAANALRSKLCEMIVNYVKLAIIFFLVSTGQMQI